MAEQNRTQLARSQDFGLNPTALSPSGPVALSAAGPVAPVAVVRQALQSGAHSADWLGGPLCDQDAQDLSTTLYLLFQDDYVERDRETGEPTDRLDRQAALLWDIVKRKGWSSARFQQALRAFQSRKHYGKQWAPGDFFESAPEADLHDRAWAEERFAHEADRLECFVIPTATDDGRTVNVQAWRYRSNVVLPFVRIYPKAV